MCGRFTHHYTWREIHDLYGLTSTPSNLEPRYNVCPTQRIPVVLEGGQGRVLATMRWGLIPAWWSKPLKEMRLATFNARAETVAEKPFFRSAFKKNRCLIPVSGYYEWHDAPGGKQPYYFTAADGAPVLTIAGIWDAWKDKESGEEVPSCAMIIAEANAWMSDIHDRMPVLLQPSQFDDWLSGKAGVEALKPAADDLLRRWPVSKRVNSSRADGSDASLIVAE